MKIALIGVAGIGKDFLADILVYEYKYIKLSFARELKRLASYIFNIPMDLSDNIKDKPFYNGYSPREVWVELAKTIRKIDNEYFIHKLFDTMNKVKSNKIVISDVRQVEELRALKQKGFIFIYITGKPKRKENEYDKNVPKLKEYCNFVFQNNFNGTQEFKEFLEKELKCI